MIKGVVSDKVGPLPYARLTVKGTRRETYTDWDGKFEIEVKDNEILIASCVGLGTMETIIDANDFYNIVIPEYKPPIPKRTKRQIRKNEGIITEW